MNANPIYWLGALGLAVLVWFFSMSDRQFERAVQLPIKVRNIPEGKTLGQEVPPTATLRYRGSGPALTKLYILQPFYADSLPIDLVRVRKRHVFYLDEYFRINPLRMPSSPIWKGLTFIGVDQPDSIIIELDDYVQKRVPIVPRARMDVRSGYIQVERLVVNPDSVLIEGPAQAVAAVDRIVTQRWDFKDVSERIDKTLDLVNPDDPMVGLIRRTARIQANIQIIDEHRLEDIPVEIINVPDYLDVIVSPSTVSLTISGGVDYIAGLDSMAVRVFVNYRTQWSPRNLFVEPQVELAPGILNYWQLTPKQLEIIAIRKLP